MWQYESTVKDAELIIKTERHPGHHKGGFNGFKVVKDSPKQDSITTNGFKAVFSVGALFTVETHDGFDPCVGFLTAFVCWKLLAHIKEGSHPTIFDPFPPLDSATCVHNE